MWINRDLSSQFLPYRGLEVAVVLGPRQVGKTSLLTRSQPDSLALISLDDLQLRSIARKDPALLLHGRPTPVILDEFQYAPELLPQIKLQVDATRLKNLNRGDASESLLYLLSGSNQIEVDRALKESLAGRVSLFSLHGLSVNELSKLEHKITVDEMIFRGGFPELYRRPTLSPIDYINDYISTFIEKDISRSAGVTKLDDFMTVTRLAAARTSNIIEYSSLGRDAGVASKTVSEWLGVLERSRITMLLQPYSSNLNSRLIKSPKLYFMDSGIAARLQGHQNSLSILGSPQAGALFENLVVAEAIKTRDHFKRSWTFSFWRTKEQEELDLIVESSGRRLLVEVKLAIQNAAPIKFTSSLKREFGERITGWVVTLGGEPRSLSDTTLQVPITEFGSKLLEYFE